MRLTIGAASWGSANNDGPRHRATDGAIKPDCGAISWCHESKKPKAVFYMLLPTLDHNPALKYTRKSDYGARRAESLTTRGELTTEDVARP